MTLEYEPGHYLARTMSQYFGESQQGTVKFCLRIQILQSLDNPGTSCKTLQREINWWISTKNLNWVMRDLCTLGYTGKTLSGVDPDTKTFTISAGKKLRWNAPMRRATTAKCGSVGDR
jgi:hypothetical protein